MKRQGDRRPKEPGTLLRAMGKRGGMKNIYRESVFRSGVGEERSLSIGRCSSER